MQRVWFNKTFSSITAALNLIRTADKEGDYRLLCSNTRPYALAALAAHEFMQEPSKLTGPAYIDWCLQFCREQNINIFVPGKEAALISAERTRFAEQGTRVLSVAEQEVLHLLHDKARFYQTVNLPAAAPAQFRIVETIAQFEAAYAELRAKHHKLCIKPAVSVYGLGFAVIDEERDSAQLLMQGTQYHVYFQDLLQGLAKQANFRTMILMEYLSGHEYSVDCVGNQGQLICAIPRKKALSAGHGQTIDRHPLIDDACATLCQAYRLNGNFNVQFREGERGLGLLEINPRMSGGIGMACLAGPNLPYLALRGFDRGFDTLNVPAIHYGIRVGELAQPVQLAAQ
jgi:carbamoylphosphate synthase large subunit